MAMAALTDSHSKADDDARRLGITRTTLYAYVNSNTFAKMS
jgi:predicted DNA-binding transcriptional regulator AlpA